jgi:hypothetical protein
MSNNHPQKTIKAAQLKWLGNMPLSTVYEDYYFSLKNSLEEIRYVHLSPNDGLHKPLIKIVRHSQSLKQDLELALIS